MKRAKVKYLLNTNPTAQSTKPPVTEAYLIETKDDIKALLAKRVITLMHEVGIEMLIKDGKTPIVVNPSGGYCPAKGTWEILERY